MGKALKAALLVAGTGLASVLLHLVWLVTGLAVAGRSLGPRASWSLLAVIMATAVTWLLGVSVIRWGLGRLGLSSPVCWGVTVGYSVLAVLTSLLLAFTSTLAFNR